MNSHQISTTDSIPLELCMASRLSKSVLFVASEEKELETIKNNISFFVDKQTSLAVIPSPSANLFNRSTDQNKEKQRMDGLSSLILGQDKVIVITTTESLLKKTIPPAYLKSLIFDLKIGQEVKMDNIKKNLLNLGYHNEEVAQNICDFAQKGELLDIITNQNNGLRIAFHHDTIESMRCFDLETGLTNKQELFGVRITPATELILNHETLTNFKSLYEARGFDANRQDYKDLVSGVNHNLLSTYTPLLYSGVSSLFEYIDPNTMIILSPFFDASIKKQIDSIRQFFETQRQELAGLTADEVYAIEECEKMLFFEKFKTLQLQMHS